MPQRLLFLFGAKRKLDRLKAAVWTLSTSKEKAVVFEKLDSALRIIESYDPRTFESLQMYVRSILIFGLPTFIARYIHKHKMIELRMEYVLDAQTTPESIACTLIHEAQHARLFRLGFGYDEPVRAHIERLCFRAQRNFARLLPKCEKLVAEAEAWMEADLESIYSNEARRQGHIKALTNLGCPGWIIRTVMWVSRRRAA